MKKTMEDIIVFTVILAMLFGTLFGIAGLAMIPDNSIPRTFGFGIGIGLGVASGLFVSAFYNDEEEKDKK